MNAEHLVALEAALAELGGLYTAARHFVALEGRAESELLPRLTSLAAHLRALVRRGGMSQDDIDEISWQILDLRAQWQAALDEIRESHRFDQARSAVERDDQRALADLLPRIFAGLCHVTAPPRACFGISAAVRRRGPGTSPFLSADACAQKIEQCLREGVTPRGETQEWWLSALPSIHFAASLADLGTPLAVTLPGAEVAAAVFESDAEIGYRIFTPRLSGGFVVEIAADIDDEWWQAFEQSFAEFRTELQLCLTARGIAHSVVVAD